MAQQTLDVVHALNERMTMNDEEIAKARRHYDVIDGRAGRKALAASWYKMCAYGTFCLALLPLIVGMAAQVVVPFVIGLFFIGLGMIPLRMSNTREDAALALESELSERRMQIERLKANGERLKQERREFLLRHETGVKQEEKALEKAAYQALVQTAAQPENSNVGGADTTECPRCAETIKVRAKACRFCNYELPPPKLAANDM